MREDQAQYNMRLNLNDSKHMKIHETLMDLDRKKHKSRNQFIIDSVYRYITEEAEIDMEGNTNKEIVQYASKDDLKKLEEKLRQDMMQMIIRVMSENNNKSITDLTIALNQMLSSNRVLVQASQQEEETEEPVDSALQDVAANFF